MHEVKLSCKTCDDYQVRAGVRSESSIQQLLKDCESVYRKRTDCTHELEEWTNEVRNRS